MARRLDPVDARGRQRRCGRQRMKLLCDSSGPVMHPCMQLMEYMHFGCGDGIAPGVIDVLTKLVQTQTKAEGVVGLQAAGFAALG